MKCIGCRSVLENYSETFPFRATYEEVLDQVEKADEEAKKILRAPRSYDKSDKKLKNEKIVTKKTDVTTDDNKKKKPKQKAISSKVIQQKVDEEEGEEEGVDEENGTAEGEEDVKQDEQTKDIKTIEESKNETATVDDDDSPHEDRVPLEELQPAAMSIRDKLQAMGKKSGPSSKAAAR